VCRHGKHLRHHRCIGAAGGHACRHPGRRIDALAYCIAQTGQVRGRIDVAAVVAALQPLREQHGVHLRRRALGHRSQRRHAFGPRIAGEHAIEIEQ